MNYITIKVLYAYSINYTRNLIVSKSSPPLSVLFYVKNSQITTTSKFSFSAPITSFTQPRDSEFPFPEQSSTDLKTSFIH